MCVEILKKVDKLYPLSQLEYIKRIKGGMSNENHLLRVDGVKMVYRYPGDEEGHFVSYSDEVANSQLRNAFDYIPTIHAINQSGEKLSTYIDGEGLSKTDDLAELGSILKHFHKCAKKATSDYNPFLRLQKYEVMTDYFFYRDAEYMLLRDYLWEKKQTLENIPKVHCHNDFHFNNIIKSFDGHIFILDWEFAGNNDPMYDIACIYMESDFESAMKVYAGYANAPLEEEIERIQDWAMFQYIQWANVALYKSLSKKYDTFECDFYALAIDFVKEAMQIYQRKYVKIGETI